MSKCVGNGGLAAHLAGPERGDTKTRSDELLPAYQDLAANVG